MSDSGPASVKCPGRAVFWTTLTGLVFWVGCAVLWWQPWLLNWLGVNHLGSWFLDSHALLSAAEAVRGGLDPHLPNPYDMLGRPHVYPHWWLLMADLGLTNADNEWLGPVFCLLFFSTVFVTVQPRRFGEMLITLAVLLSTPVLLALERANNDLVVFAVLAPVPWLMSGAGRKLPYLAIAFVMIATGLKFYPAALLFVLLFAGERQKGLLYTIIAISALALTLFDLRHDIALQTELAPVAIGLETFGASQVFMTLGMDPGPGRLAGVLAGVLIVLLVKPWRYCRDWVTVGKSDRAEASFLMGAVLLVGCFFAGTNFAYRWIHSLFLLPLLLRLSCAGNGTHALKTSARIMVGLLIAALWIDSGILRWLQGMAPHRTTDQILAIADALAAIRQPLHWTLFIWLSGALVARLSDSAAWAMLSARRPFRWLPTIR